MRLFGILVIMSGVIASCNRVEETDRVTEAHTKVQTELGKHFGKPVFLRIIKEDHVLELWLQEGGHWRVLKPYPILAMSGTLGPKTREGDCQAPEGFYATTLSRLNPCSKYHLSFNIGYPNEYDRSLGRTGSFIMVHGKERSIGCFAMGDDGIEEIYTLVHQALLAGQPSIPVQVYPFEMTTERMEKEKSSHHYTFWEQHLLPGWQHTQQFNEPAPFFL